MESIIIYLLLACINLPFALNKQNKARGFSWVAFGFNLGLLAAHLINHYR
jgi:hypothetical protein